jgi:hypothetical protein
LRNIHDAVADDADDADDAVAAAADEDCFD